LRTKRRICTMRDVNSQWEMIHWINVESIRHRYDEFDINWIFNWRSFLVWVSLSLSLSLSLLINIDTGYRWQEISKLHSRPIFEKKIYLDFWLIWSVNLRSASNMEVLKFISVLYCRPDLSKPRTSDRIHHYWDACKDSAIIPERINFMIRTLKGHPRPRFPRKNAMSYLGRTISSHKNEKNGKEYLAITKSHRMLRENRRGVRCFANFGY